MHDVVIVGSRCAGAPLAMLLARAGLDVLAVDRATFPSDTMSTHFLQPPAMVRLIKWGLLDGLMNTGCPPITRGRLEFGGQVLDGVFGDVESGRFLAAPRRTFLDKFLIDSARHAGAEIREGMFLERLVEKDGAVEGVALRGPDGEEVVEEATIVIGADGRNSRVAELVGAAYQEFHDPVSCGYYGYYKGDFDNEVAAFRMKENQTTVTFPTHDAHVIIAAWDVARFSEVKKDPETHLIEAFREIPETYEPLTSALLTEKVIGAALPSFVRKSVGPGWALVGDAAYHKDPTPADGINDAFRAVDFLAEALIDGFSDKASMEQALERYEARRNESTARSLPATLKVSSFGVSSMGKGQASMDLTAWRGEEAFALSDTLR